MSPTHSPFGLWKHDEERKPLTILAYRGTNSYVSLQEAVGPSLAGAVQEEHNGIRPARVVVDGYIHLIPVALTFLCRHTVEKPSRRALG